METDASPVRQYIKRSMDPCSHYYMLTDYPHWPANHMLENAGARTKPAAESWSTVWSCYARSQADWKSQPKYGNENASLQGPNKLVMSMVPLSSQRSPRSTLDHYEMLFNASQEIECIMKQSSRLRSNPNPGRSYAQWLKEWKKMEFSCQRDEGGKSVN